MKTVMNIEELLDVLGDTSVIVIRQQDEKILYLNKKAKEINPEFQKNTICHGLWKGKCENCPIKNIEDKKYNKTVVYSESTNEIIDICAMSILWKGITPAFVITMSPHIATEEEKESEIAKSWLTHALSQVYEMAVVNNLSKNEYVVFHNGGIIDLPENGKTQVLFDNIEKKLEEDYKENWRSIFSIENLLESFQNGEKKVLLDLYFEKEKRWFSCGCFLLESTYSKEILSIILVRDITESKHKEKEQQIQLEFTHSSMRGASGKYLVTEEDIYLLEGSPQYFEILCMEEKEYYELKGKVLPWLEEAERRKYIQTAIENGKNREPLLWEAPRKMSNGMVHWFQLQGMFIGEQSGYPVYYGILLDTSERKRLEIEQKATFNSLPGGVAKIRLDDRLTILEVNDYFFEMFGKTTGAGFFSSIYSIDRKIAQREFDKMIQQHSRFKMELRMLDAREEIMWIHLEGNEFSIENGIPVCLFVMIDITNYIEMRLQLEEVKEKYHKNIAGSNHRILVYDNNHDHFEFIDEAADEQYYKSIPFQYHVKDDKIVFSEAIKNQIGMKICYENFKQWLLQSNVVFQGDMNILKNIYNQCMIDNISIKAQLRFLTINGSYEWFEIHCNPLWDENKKQCLKIVGTLVNINALRQMQSEATTWRERARRDPLTGLYNRAIFREKVLALLEEDTKGALIFMDVDYFKKVNDTLGHAIGDDVLLTVAKRLKGFFRESEDVIARYGGDEFIVFLKNVCTEQDLKKKLQQLLEVFREKYQRGDTSWNITGSVGAAFYPQDASDYQMLLEKADTALYVSKNKGRDRFTLYSDCNNEE